MAAPTVRFARAEKKNAGKAGVIPGRGQYPTRNSAGIARVGGPWFDTAGGAGAPVAGCRAGLSLIVPVRLF